MNERDRLSHPDVIRIAEYATGGLDDDESRELRAHIESCPDCRLELRSFERFQEIDTDGELARDAGWDSARFKLERAFAERVVPSIVAGRDAGRAIESGEGISRSRDMRRRPRFGLLAPLAAAAAVLLIFIQLERTDRTGIGAAGPMRGEGVPERGILLESPVGNIDRPPEIFSWRSKHERDYFALEIFTSDLRTLHRMEHIEESSWSVPDSLASLFERGTIYLWNVRGYRGLEREVVSPNAWFRIGGE